MGSSYIVSFGIFDRNVFDLSKKWLSDSEMKQWIMATDITNDERENWFLSLNGRKDYLIESVLYDNKAIGAVGLKHINREQKVAEYFGYIGEKSYLGLGIGKHMISHVNDIVNALSLKMLYLRVCADNLRAYNLYLKNGYIDLLTISNVVIMVKIF